MAVDALRAIPVEIEVHTSRGMKFYLVGLPDNAVKESHERIKAALQNTGYKFPGNQITINMAPADIRKEGSGYDLPIAIGVLASTEVVSSSRLKRYILVGELGLDGSLRPIRGALLIAIEARAKGFEGLILPKDNAREAAVVNKLKVYGAQNLCEVVDFLNGKDSLLPTDVNTREEFYAHQSSFPLDFSDVRGQENVKRAAEVAAAGGHNMILVGSPGCGKSMIAKRIPSILPPLSLAESLETTQIYSSAGKLGKNASLIALRPFRSPHHTISDVALIGGGTNFQPGEISLAHNGVLFLDELPEFSRSALETLRQPLEDRAITVSRTKYSVNLPCSFMLVASMNPCPCGYYGHPTHKCTCSPAQIKKYMSKVSGPLLDRIDLQVEVSPVPFHELQKSATGEPSSTIRDRVIKARKAQEIRFSGTDGIYCNAQMQSNMLSKLINMDKESEAMLATAMKRLNLSARAYERILKVARTIADLDSSADVRMSHISEAIGYRNLDRAGWGE